MQYAAETVIEHHGILGQKWGIRRFQNKDGSLTRAGLKRYGSVANFNKVRKAEEKAKAAVKKAKYDKKTAKELAAIKKKYGIDRIEEAKKKEKEAKKNKNIEDMTDKELQKRIQRATLENQLKNLMPKKEAGAKEKTENEILREKVENARLKKELAELTKKPEKISAGKKFMNKLGDAVVPALANSAKDLAMKYISKQLGLDGDTAKKASERLQRQAQDARNRYLLNDYTNRLNNLNNPSSSNSNSSRSSDSSSNSNSSGSSDSSSNGSSGSTRRTFRITNRTSHSNSVSSNSNDSGGSSSNTNSSSGYTRSPSTVFRPSGPAVHGNSTVASLTSSSEGSSAISSGRSFIDNIGYSGSSSSSISSGSSYVTQVLASDGNTIYNYSPTRRN